MQCKGQRQLGVEILRSKILLGTLYTAEDSCHKRSESKEAFQGREVVCMTKEQFWRIIEDVNAVSQNHDQETVWTRIVENLSHYPLEDIMDWHLIYHEYKDAAYRDEMFAVSTALGSDYADEGLNNFRAWLISCGKEVFMNALREPVTLVDSPKKDGCFNYGKYDYAAFYAYNAKMFRIDPDSTQDLIYALEDYTLDRETIEDIHEELPKQQGFGQNGVGASFANYYSPNCGKNNAPQSDAIQGSKGTLSEKDFISSRCYTLLSYLAVTAGNRATANQLALILWPDESCEIPMKSVRNIAYRLRSLLGYVGLEDLVVYANGIFSFNPEIKVVTDVGLFEELCDSIEMENNPKKRYRLYEAAVGLYSGNLLPRLSDNIYFIPSITYYQGLYFRLAGRYIERQTECGEYVYAHKAAKAALAFDPFNSSLNMHLTILLYQQLGAGTANAFYTGIKRHLTEAHIQRIKQTCPNMII